MYAKDNDRLKEVALSICLNHIDKTSDATLYRTLLQILLCIAKTMGGKSPVLLEKLTESSLCDGFMMASDREIVAAVDTFMPKALAAKRMNITYPAYSYRYRYIKNPINKEFLENLEPLYKSDEEKLLINVLFTFINEFKVPIGDVNHRLKNHKRTLELEFLMIYDALMTVFQNEVVVARFIYYICETFGIDYQTIIHLKNNVHVINRSYPKSKWNNRYFIQELTTLYTSKGFSKSFIGKNVLNKNYNYLYCERTKALYKNMQGEEAWQYGQTLYWNNINDSEVIKFIDLLHTFIKYDV